MVKVADRVKVSTATTGTGTITLGSAVSGFVVVPASLNNQTLRYVIEEGNAFEIGTGTYTHSGTTLSRTLTVSSTGSLLDLSGNATVFLSLAAADIQELLDFSNLFSLPSSDGTSGQALTTDGSGSLTFSTISSGGGSSLSDPIKQTEFTGSATTTFSVNYTAGNINVFLNGSKLAASDFTATNGTSVVLGSACAATDVVTVVEYGAPFASQYSSSIFTVGSSSEYNTSSKVLTTDYTASKVAVYLNGVKLLIGTDCVATNGTTIDLTNAAPVTGDKIEVVEHGTLADSVTTLTGLSDTPSSLGSAGQVLQVNSGGNALEFSDAGGAVTVYNNYSDLPSTGNTDGDLGWVKDVSGSGATKALYVWDGAEWDRVYSDAQEGPEFTTSPASSYNLTGGVNTDVTVAASDPDGFPIEYTVVTNPTNQAQATITQPSTGTFRFAASSTSTNAGSFTAKFVASDGVQKATASASFSLAFAVYGDRGLTGAFSSSYNDINFYDITTTGNASDFGDLLATGNGAAACGNGSRALFAGQGSTNVIQYVTTSVTGNATDFGDLTTARQRFGACADVTRGIFAGGISSNVIDYVTIATTGDATDFGDLSGTATACAACADATRGVIGGQIGSNGMEHITIATTANSSVFGDLTVSRSQLASTADDTRGLFIGGFSDSATIDYITIASTGNATDFGDVSATLRRGSACSNGTRAVFHCAPSSNTLEYVTIQTLGNSSDFGDLTQVGAYTASTSGAAS